MTLLRIACVQAFTALLAATALSGACAATLSVTPLRLELDSHHRADILTLKNGGDEPLRIQVRSMHWDMAASDGQWQLSPSDDLIVTPQLLEIPAGQSAQLRIGSLLDAGVHEASYRLLLDELPALTDATSAQSPKIRVLTQVSLPVFLEPAQINRVPVVSTAAIEHGALVIGIDDRGTQRLDPQNIKLTLIDGDGRVLEQRDQMTNYVLPGSTSFLHVKLSSDVCQRAASVSVSWISATTSSPHPIRTGAEACEDAYP